MEENVEGVEVTEGMEGMEGIEGGVLECTVDTPLKENDGTKDAYISYLITTHVSFTDYPPTLRNMLYLATSI